MAKLSGKWEGGRTYVTDSGETVYVIRKMVAGHRFQHVLSGVAEAHVGAELSAFLRDPFAYKPPRKAAADRAGDLADAVVLKDTTVAGYLKDTVKHGGIASRSPHYKRACRRYLAAWADALAGRDLRKIEPREVLRLLHTWKKAEQKRIAALKAFCGWLVKTGQLDPAQDPSRSLVAPSAVPERQTREKGFTRKFVERLYAAVDDQAARDMLCLRAKTGMHDTEIRRIADGDGQITDVKHEVIKATIKFPHKRRADHIVSVDAQTRAAALRLQALQEMPTFEALRYRVNIAAEKAGLTKRVFRDGQNRPAFVNLSELRHSFVAWCLEDGETITLSGRGVPLALVASVLGHTSTATTKKFYDVSKYPAMIRIPLVLAHPDDPSDREVQNIGAK